MFCWRMIRANLVEALAEIDDLCERLRYLEMGTLPEGAPLRGSGSEVVEL